MNLGPSETTPYSRYVTGWMLAHCESSDLASRLIRETVENQGVSSRR